MVLCLSVTTLNAVFLIQDYVYDVFPTQFLSFCMPPEQHKTAKVEDGSCAHTQHKTQTLWQLFLLLNYISFTLCPLLAMM